MPQLSVVPPGAPAAQFPFGRDFQIGILALMAQRIDFCTTAVELFLPEYFEDKVLVWYFQTMRAHFIKYRELPVVSPVLSNELTTAVRTGKIKATDIAAYATVGEQMKQRVPSQQYKIEECIKFCRRQAGRKLYLETAGEMDTADDTKWDEILDRMQKVVALGSGYVDIGTDYFGSINDRLARRQSGDNRRVLSTGMHQMDMRMGGGVKDGQLAMWLGGTGRGKSIALCHNGYIGVAYKRKVAHYTLELDEQEVADRYDALWSQTPIQELNIQHVRVRDKLNNLMMTYGKSLMIKSYPTGSASVNTIKAHLQMLEGMNWVPDVVIIDYGDLLKPLTAYQDEYSDLGAIFRDLRGLAGEMRVPVWTATQANRAGLNAEVVDIEHIGDSLKKAQIADVIIALCANQDEIKNGIMRLFVAKNRNGPDKWTLEIGTAYEKMTLFDVIKNGQMQLASAQAAAQGGAPPPTVPAGIP